MTLGGGGKLDPGGAKQLQRPRGVADRAGMSRTARVFLHQRDGHSVAGEEHRRGQPYQAAADDHYRLTLDDLSCHDMTEPQLIKKY
jgi:hypothetical protein